MDILQLLNEAEDIKDGRQVAPTSGKKVQSNKVERDKVAKCLVYEGVTARLTLTSIFKESVDAKRPSNCCARREASAPQQVEGSTNPWHVSQCVNPPCTSRAKEGVQQALVFYK